MNLFLILAATLVAGIGSVWIAALLMRVGVRNGRGGLNAQHLLSLAAGALLATAFMHLLPEAFEGGVEPSRLFAALLFGVVFFFLLDKAELWHHGHEHHGGATVPGHGHAHANDHDHGHGHGHGHGHAHAHATSRTGGWTVLTGDSVHCFGDGILIASAFAADARLGVVAAVSVLAHEVPHHIGDLVVLRQTSASSRAAVVKVSLAGTMTALGGLIGWWLLDQLHGLLPYFLVLASSSFIYVALADLIPQLQKRLPARQTAAQIAWLATGIVVVTLVSTLAHGGHDHGHAGEGGPAHGHEASHHEGDGHDHGADAPAGGVSRPAR